MKITILTLFPEMFAGVLEQSILKRAIAKGAAEIELIDIRSFTKDKYGRVDSAPTGGGAGLILKCQPVLDALKSVRTKESHVVLLSPRGRTYQQAIAHEYTHYSHLILICGHYEGLDERISSYVDEELSIGDYILTGGEIGAMAVLDSVIRLLDGAITKESTEEESFEQGLLEYPQYTEPYEYDGKVIPNILYSGNHKAIAAWRKKEALRITKERRPDLLEHYSMNKQEQKLWEELQEDRIGKWETDAIEKGKKFTKK